MPSPPQGKQGRSRLLQVFDHSGHNQFFLRSGHGDVENAQFLRQTVPFQFNRYGILSEVLTLHPSFGIDIIHAHSRIHVRHQRAAALLFAKALRQSRHKTDRELQPLALVDAHNPHHIRILILHGGLSVIHFIFFQLFHVAQKMIKSEITCLFKIRRLHQKHIHISPPSASLRSCSHMIQIAGFPQNRL